MNHPSTHRSPPDPPPLSTGQPDREAQYRNVANSSPTGLWLTDSEGKVSYLNQTLIDWTGMTNRDLLGADWAKAILENDRQRVVDAFGRAIATRTHYDVEFRLTKADGCVIWCRAAGDPYYHPDGQYAGYTGFCMDIQTMIETQRQLQESEERFRTMAEGTDILIAVGDQTSNATYFNKAWVELTGRSMEQLLRFGWVDLLHPQDRDRYVAIYLDAFRVHKPFTGEFRVLTPSGAYHWLLAQGTARFQADGSFAGYISACVDITERKGAEEQQRQERLAFERAYEQARLSKEAAQLGTFDMDMEKGTMIWDERCRILFGISHSHTVTYETDFVPNLHPDDRQRVVRIINDVFNKAVSNGDYDVDYRTIGVDDQQIRWVRAKGKAYFNDQDKPVRFIGSVLDITPQVEARQQIEQIVADRTRELKVANQQLTESNELLVRSNENLQRFAYVASHDLQEPLRKIQQFGDLLQTRYADSPGDELAYVGRMQSAASRMSTLIRDLLSFSRISVQPPADTLVSLQAVLVRILQDLDHRVAQTGARVAVGILPTVKGDALQLSQLFQNLLSNALKFHRGGVVPVIEVTCQPISAASLPPGCRPVRLADGYYQVNVRDNGIGFEQQYVDRIFEVFQRLHTRTEFEGTGIGLAICQKVAANHGGAITASSQPGQGATFRVYLPVG
jgi:PAS domain S-box-containing protein